MKLRRCATALFAAIGFIVATIVFVPPAAQAATCASGSTTNTASLFWRETTKYGYRDTDVYHIQHVRELQRRLKRAGLFTLYQPTGSFYSYTKSELIKFQRRYGLCATGVADQKTWQVLIQKTTRGFSRVPARCKGAGWWVCYDRTLHELFAYKDGRIRNVWLVRGGSYSLPTRVGTFRVYAKYSYKISSTYGTPMYYFQKFNGGQGFHGSVTMMDPFIGHSHGCINMYIEDSRVLWNLTRGYYPRVSVYGAWA